MLYHFYNMTACKAAGDDNEMSKAEVLTEHMSHNAKKEAVRVRDLLSSKNPVCHH
jgi:hypothetical protein